MHCVSYCPKYEFLCRIRRTKGRGSPCYAGGTKMQIAWNTVAILKSTFHRFNAMCLLEQNSAKCEQNNTSYGWVWKRFLFIYICCLTYTEPECIVGTSLSLLGMYHWKSQVAKRSSNLNVLLGRSVIEFNRCCVYDIFKMACSAGTRVWLKTN